MIELSEIKKRIDNLPPNSKTKDLDEIIKSYYRLKEPVNFDPLLLKENVWLAKAFFFINAHYIKDPNKMLDFIDTYKSVFYYWYSTDSIIKLVSKADPNLIFKYATSYVKSKETYTRRWGYVMFMFHNERKNGEFVNKFLTLFKEDEEETIQNAEAWLLCEFAVFNPLVIYNFLIKKTLGYKITSRAISKIHDSFRISDEWKNKFKQIRETF